MGSHSQPRSLHEYHMSLLENGQDSTDSRKESGLKLVASLGLKYNDDLATVSQEIRNGSQPRPASRSLWSSNREFGVVTLGNVNIEIFVRDFQGYSHTFTISKSATVDQLMRMVEDKIRVANCQQRLVFGTHELQRGHSLESYNIRDGSTIHLTGRLRGGASRATAS